MKLGDEMIENLFDWYMQEINKLNLNASDVLSQGSKVGTNFYSTDFYVFEGKYFYVKDPHTRGHKREIIRAKNSRLDFGFQENIRLNYTSLDNELATMSELISEKKYRAYKYITAKHFTIQNDNDYYIMSPNMFLSELDYETFTNIDVNAPFHKEDSKKFGASILINSANTSLFDMEKWLKRKDRFLSFMTEHCYDQMIKFFLSSIFEFGDDDTLYNIILVKNKESSRFEDMFVFDKESTLFNFLIAHGDNFAEIKQQIKDYKDYDDYRFGKSNITVRVETLRDFFDRGLLNGEHRKHLERELEVNYDKLANEISAETGLRKNQTQIDCYKHGQDYISDILEKI